MFKTEFDNIMDPETVDNATNTSRLYGYGKYKADGGWVGFKISGMITGDGGDVAKPAIIRHVHPRTPLSELSAHMLKEVYGETSDPVNWYFEVLYEGQSIDSLKQFNRDNGIIELQITWLRPNLTPTAGDEPAPRCAP